MIKEMPYSIRGLGVIDPDRLYAARNGNNVFVGRIIGQDHRSVPFMEGSIFDLTRLPQDGNLEHKVERRRVTGRVHKNIADVIPDELIQDYVTCTLTPSPASQYSP